MYLINLHRQPFIAFLKTAALRNFPLVASPSINHAFTPRDFPGVNEWMLSLLSLPSPSWKVE